VKGDKVTMWKEKVRQTRISRMDKRWQSNGWQCEKKKCVRHELIRISRKQKSIGLRR